MSIRTALTAAAILCTLAVRAGGDFRSAEVPRLPDEAFAATLDALEAEGYFVVWFDRESRFIQAKTFVPSDKGPFSRKKGERLTLNLRIRPVGKLASALSLAIYREECYTEKFIDYYADKGVSDDPKLYGDVLRQLTEKLADTAADTAPAR